MGRVGKLFRLDPILCHAAPLMKSPKVRVAVIGASGYTGQELLRLLVMHPQVDLVAVTSRQEAGRALTSVFPRLAGAPAAEGLSFIDPEIEAIVATGAEAAFLALPHGVAAEFAVPLLKRGIRLIDLSADFRLRDAEVYAEFYGHAHPAPDLLTRAVYGLPEFYRETIATSDLVASPGCYPTSILVPLVPLIRKGLVKSGGIAVSSLSGVSGAGKKAETSLLFAEVNESLRAYGAPKHRHLSEIEQELSIAAGEKVTISFVPHLMPVTAGILTTIFCEAAGDLGTLSASIAAAYAEAYADSPFVRIRGEGGFADTKHVVRTNFVDVGWVVDRRTGRLILSSAEDNLGKGAGSQAIQSFNVMFGLPETAGLLQF
jgi:N-acetyl-gamma-glutamyl-phosphate reductase